MPTLSPQRTMTEVLHSGSENLTNDMLCPELAVPPGSECILAVRAVVNRAPQELRFDIMDSTGNRVLVAEVAAAGVWRSSPAAGRTLLSGTGRSIIRLRSPDGEMIACAFQQGSEMEASKDGATMEPGLEENLTFDIFRNENEPFACLKKDLNQKWSAQYVLISEATRTPMMLFYGSFNQHSVNVWGPPMRRELLAATEKRRMEFDPDNEYFVVRVAPEVDAGLVLCCVLALNKMEVDAPST